MAAAKDDDEQERWNACQHLACIGHSCEIRPDVEHIRNEQRCAGHVHEWLWIVTFERARQAGSRDEADTGARQFDRLHQRQRDHRGPQRAVTEAGSRDGVRRDSGRIVIGRTRDEPRAQQAKVTSRDHCRHGGAAGRTLEQRASQDDHRDREVDHEAGDVDERGDERRRRRGRVEAQAAAGRTAAASR